MIGETISTLGLSRDEWVALRRRGIGGSDVAKVAGISKWGTPLTLFLEKTGAITPEEPGEAAYWGEVLEDVVAAEFSKRTGIKVRRKNAICFHKEYPWMLANIDREVVGTNKGLECKTASAYLHEEWKDDEVPDQYYLQVQHYIEVMGWDSCYIACLVGGQRFIWKEIPRDDETIKGLIEIEREFWRRVEANDPPPLGLNDDPEIIYPVQSRQDLIEPDEDVLSIAEQLAEIREKITSLQASESEIISRLKERIGENAGIKGVAMWTTVKPRDVIDMTRVASSLASMVPNGDEVLRRLMEKNRTVKPGGRRFLFRYKRPEEGVK
jgi:putative phage-type endonuclease